MSTKTWLPFSFSFSFFGKENLWLMGIQFGFSVSIFVSLIFGITTVQPALNLEIAQNCCKKWNARRAICTRKDTVKVTIILLFVIVGYLATSYGHKISHFAPKFKSLDFRYTWEPPIAQTHTQCCQGFREGGHQKMGQLHHPL